MAFLHLLNCVLLTFAPIFVIFNSTSLHEYGARSCLGGVFGYVLASMAKLLAYATLVPLSEEWSIISELPKELITLIDIYVLTTVFSWKASRTADKKTRMIGIGLGWGAAELICSHLLIFIVNAGGGEFSWEYMQRAINANWGLFQVIVVACLVYIRNTSSGVMPLLTTILLGAQLVVRPLFISYGLASGILNDWTMLCFQSIWTLCFVTCGKVVVELTS